LLAGKLHFIYNVNNYIYNGNNKNLQLQTLIYFNKYIL
jgi:hypothetical protein